MINLHYIRAAIEAATGIHLTLPEVRTYLLEEGLITQRQADEDAQLFTGYDELYEYDDASTYQEEYDVEMGLPDTYIS
jgi:hypothetical protein